MIKSFKKFFCTTSKYTHRCNFGQGGIVKMNLQNNSVNLKLHTTWNDYSEIHVNQNDKDKFNFKVQENQHIVNDYLNLDETLEPLDIISYIPEYFSLDIQIYGSIYHTPYEGISNQIYGNLRIVSQSGSIFFNKAKCEEAIIETQEGNIEFKKYLESFSLLLQNFNGNTDIKRLGISGKAIINQKQGDINIESLYTDKIKQTEYNANNVDIQNSIIQLKNQVQSCQKNLTINHNQGNLNIKNVHGNLYLYCQNQGNVNLDRVSASRIWLELNEKDANIHLLELLQNSYIETTGDNCKGNKCVITVEPTFNASVFSLDLNKYLFDDQQNKIILYIKGNIHFEVKQKSLSIIDQLNKFKLLRENNQS